jgi:hypothetical protein
MSKAGPATHAFVGFAKCGKANVIEVDEGKTMRWATKYIRNGGRVERMPLDDARKQELCFGCPECKP